jgi:hypothetical protein
MAITINDTVNPTVSPDENSGQPSALLQIGEVDVDLDNSYPNPGGAVVGGYDVSASFSGAVVLPSPFVPDWDGAALRWFRMVNDSGTPKLQSYADDNASPGAQTANLTDLSGHTDLIVPFFYK